ncbi:MAG: hypothetical protein WC506_00850 [Candidatus Micrarchaeia archaeon]
MKFNVYSTDIDMTWKHAEIFLGSMLLLAMLSAPFYFIDVGVFGGLVSLFMPFLFPLAAMGVSGYFLGEKTGIPDLLAYSGLYFITSILGLFLVVSSSSLISPQWLSPASLLSLLGMLFSLPFSIITFFAIMYVALEFRKSAFIAVLKPSLAAYVVACLAYWIVDFSGSLQSAFGSYGAKILFALLITHIPQLVYVFALAYLVVEGRFNKANLALLVTFICLLASSVFDYMVSFMGSDIYGSAAPDAVTFASYLAFIGVCALFIYLLAAGKYKIGIAEKHEDKHEVKRKK